MKNSNILRKMTFFLFIVVAMLTTSCKKDKIDPNLDPNLIGTWSSVRAIGSFRNIVTQLELNENKSGNERITNITTSSSTTTSDEDLKWKTQNNNVLIITFNSGGSEEFTYLLEPDGITLILTSPAGVRSEFFKQE